MAELVTKGPGRIAKLWLRPAAPFNSCGRWGYIDGPAYAVGTLERDQRARPIFIARFVGVETWASKNVD